MKVWGRKMEPIPVRRLLGVWTHIVFLSHVLKGVDLAFIQASFNSVRFFVHIISSGCYLSLIHVFMPIKVSVRAV